MFRNSIGLGVIQVSKCPMKTVNGFILHQEEVASFVIEEIFNRFLLAIFYLGKVDFIFHCFRRSHPFIDDHSYFCKRWSFTSFTFPTLKHKIVYPFRTILK